MPDDPNKPAATPPAADPNGPPATPPAATPPGAPAETPPGTPAANPGTPPATGEPATPPAGDPPADPPADDDTTDPKLREARRDAGKYRTQLRAEETARQAAEARATASDAEKVKFQELIDGFNKLLNPDSNQPADPDALAKQLADEQAARQSDTAERDKEIRSLRIAAALPAAFSAKVNGIADADAELMTAVLKADGELDNLDPSSQTFAADLASAVATKLEKNSRLKAAQAVTTTGTEPTGRSGATDQLTLEQVRSMNPEQLVEAQRAGKLKSVLGRS